MALKFFAEQKCDLVIWETGLGGRLDATNIVTPLASVITNIALDHQQWLGDTLEKIAAEKAGIIKPGVPVITAEEGPEALAVIEKIAREKNASLINVGQASSLSPSQETKKLETGKMPVLPLPGDHQKLNAALAIATVETLQSEIPVSEAAIRTGLETVNWPGRLQLVTLPNGQRALLDGAHNVAGAKALREALSSWSSIPRPAGLSDGTLKRELQQAGPSPGASGKTTLILGVLQDKDWPQICRTLAPTAARIFTVPVASERTADERELAAACRAANPAAEIAACDSLRRALEQTANDRFVVVTGSLYLVGEALELLGLSPATGDERALNEWNVHPQPLHKTG
jgi:dihydrofolate synthase/folylpolyglutamate synthase